MSNQDDTEGEFVISCGNVFADLGLPNAGEELAKAKLALVMRRRIETLNLTQTAAAELLRTDQAKVSQLVNGKIAGFTLDRLIRFANELKMNVRITLEPTADEKRGETLVTTV